MAARKGDDVSAEDSTDPPTDMSANMQAHLLRAAKMPAGPRARAKGRTYETRNWSLFFFFRIMQQAEMRETATRLKAAKGPKPVGAPAAKGSFLKDSKNLPSWRSKLDLAMPAMLNGGLASQAASDERRERRTFGAAGGESAEPPIAPADPPAAAAAKVTAEAPAQAFLNWLKVLVRANDEDRAAVLDSAKRFSADLGNAGVPPHGAMAALDPTPDWINTFARALADEFLAGDLEHVVQMARSLDEVIGAVRANYPGILAAVHESIDATPAQSPHGPLARMILYELLRQGAPIFLDEQPASSPPDSADRTVLPVLRAEKSESKRLKAREAIDRTPITMAFSYQGLKALDLHPYTLASFPEAFKEGMAARARRLGDIGPSAPENWEGELGLTSVHGYFTGGSNLEPDRPYAERFWKALRDEIRLFNDPTAEDGAEMRAWIGLMFRLIGLEIVHIELGQDPYEVDRRPDPDGEVVRLPGRVEHFGFRDGLSQPFVDMGVGETLPGGGTADRRGTWRPVAPGEIYLDRLDESGQEHLLPLHPCLRAGSTYLVFRKLEQDVEGFRAFLEQQRPGDPTAQKKLSAQFFGRWPSGTSLVQSPYADRGTAGAGTEAALNDFRYAADDPLGRKCPLAAHVRRSNPRDTGGRNDVRHHRILRRGIAYGGPLLPEGEPFDGEKRGILFIAANARIDLQFEVVQGDWLNRGEFLGQAGLDRCPIAGANDGSVRARFLEAGAVAPVTGLPSFVTMRGGDYFFAPGIKALEGMADGFDFEVAVADLPYRGHTMADVATPALFADDRLARYWSSDLGRGRPVRVNAGVAPPGIPQPEKVAFVGRYDQVRKVLSNDKRDDHSVYFSVEPYCTAGRRITRGQDFLIGTDAAGSDLRDRLFGVLKEAWRQLQAPWQVPGTPDPRVGVRAAAAARLDATLRRTAGARRIDLVDDLAVQAAYGVLDKVYGIRGPTWLTELAGALPFARQHVGDLPADWIAAFRGERPTDPGLKTMQVWTTFLVADLIGNSQNQQPLQAVARQAGTEMLNHIDQCLFEAQGKGPLVQPTNLIESFLFNAQQLGRELQQPRSPEEQSLLYRLYSPSGKNWLSDYQKDVAIVLLEILGSTLAVIPLTFGSVMAKLLELRIDLPMLLPRLADEGVGHIVYEAERLNPNSAVRVRRCVHAVEDEKLSWIQEGDFVAALIAKANMDRKIFWRPERFSLGESDPRSDFLKKYVDSDETHPRALKNYLLFGVEGSNKYCWGAGPVAMPVLKECIYAAGRLQGLRNVAGPLGEPQKIGTVTIGLSARFTRILSKDAREQ